MTNTEAGTLDYIGNSVTVEAEWERETIGGNNSFRNYFSLVFISSLPLSSSIIINSVSRPFIIVICSVHCALLAVLSGVGLCHQRFVP